MKITVHLKEGPNQVCEGVSREWENDKTFGISYRTTKGEQKTVSFKIADIREIERYYN